MTDSSTEKAKAEKLARRMAHEVLAARTFQAHNSAATEAALPFATLLVQMEAAIRHDRWCSMCADGCDLCDGCTSAAALSAYEALMKAEQ